MAYMAINNSPESEPLNQIYGESDQNQLFKCS